TKIVNTYFENAASSEKVEKNADLFVIPDVCVVGIAKGAGRDKVWSKKVADLIPEQKKELQNLGRDIPHKVDAVKVELVDKALAVARVTYSNEFVKPRGVFTLTSEGGAWKIASFVFEPRFPDQD